MIGIKSIALKITVMFFISFQSLKGTVKMQKKAFTFFFRVEKLLKVVPSHFTC